MLVLMMLMLFPIVDGGFIMPFNPHHHRTQLAQHSSLLEGAAFATIQALPCIAASTFVILTDRRDRRSEALVLCFLLILTACTAFVVGYAMKLDDTQ